MYMILRVHILSKKVTYIKLKVIGCSPHPIHEYFKVTTLLLTLVTYSLDCIHVIEYGDDLTDQIMFLSTL